MTHTIRYRSIFIGVGNVLPEDVLVAIPSIVDTTTPYILQPVALPHAPVGNKYAWVDPRLHSDARYPVLISALDDHLDNVGDDVDSVPRGSYSTSSNDFEVSMLRYHYDDLAIWIYRCTLA